jgi:putative flippase GtrA
VTSLVDRISTFLRASVDRVWREAAKFGVVGAIAFIIDVGGFNLLFHGPLSGRLTSSRIISGVLATLVAWLGNRFWTFRHRVNRKVHHEALLFFLVNGVGLLIGIGWLNLTFNTLGLTSAWWVNLNNVFGIGLATLFRFWAYRRFVFAGELDPDTPDPSPCVEPDPAELKRPTGP